MKFILFLTIVFVLAITACEKQCIKANLRFGLVGFSDSEADTILIKRFAKNDVTTARDSFLIENIGFQRNNDSLTMVSFPGEATLESDYNYEIFFPETGELITISNIQEDKETMTKGLFNCTKEACINSITSCSVNGQFTNSIVHPDLIYLKK